METNEKPDDFLVTEEGQKYLKGFNEGYILAQEMPDLALSLAEIKSTDARIEGLRNGVEEYVHEKARDCKAQWMGKGLPQDKEDRSRDIDMDKG